jgi:predicted helicase
MYQLKPTHKPVKDFYKRRAELTAHKVMNELSIRDALQSLLQATAKSKGLFFVSEKTLQNGVRPDGVIYDEYQFRRAVWESKDTRDDLDVEIRNKRKAGYPFDNILFENNDIAVLIQGGREVFRCSIEDVDDFIELLNRFFDFNIDYIDDFEKAVDAFKAQIPEIGEGLNEKIQEAHQNNPRFITAFDSFFTLCRNSLNPNIRIEAVDEMIIQHLLTERVLRTVFNSVDFASRNPIAAEVERVIAALTSQSFNRHEFLGRLDRFYRAIEDAARHITDFSEKQFFLNTIYERFFQGYSIKTADTHGIVYTPQEIVDFMCSAVEEVLQTEFGKRIGDPGINILDPCTGTGNFIINLLNRVAKHNPEGLERAYRQQFFANEVMLMPYYIAALNIEHAFYDLTGQYEPFEGVCFVDTLDLISGQGAQQLGLFTEINSGRVKRQKESPIFVVIGNPPYNAGQVNENDNNQNRKYPHIDGRVGDTYVKESKATLRNKLYDPYVKFFRWASDRLQGQDGIVSFVTNNSFVDSIMFDGMRKCLLDDFTRIYHFNFKGNARTSGKRRQQEGGNIFNDLIRVGVGITVLVRRQEHKDTRVYYHAVKNYWKVEEKRRYLAGFTRLSDVPWQQLHPNRNNDWLVPPNEAQFNEGLPLGDDAVKRASGNDGEAFFKLYSLGVSTNRDAHVYSFDRKLLLTRVQKFIDIYNTALAKLSIPFSNYQPDDVIDTTDQRIKWTARLKDMLKSKKITSFSIEHIKKSLYRPYCTQYLYFDNFWNDRQLQIPNFVSPDMELEENKIIAISGLSSNKNFHCLLTNLIPDLHLTGDTQCFAFYRYEDNGTRVENITNWALAQFRQHYADDSISKWDIFYYVYGLLHHPAYAITFKDSLKKHLPRIPYAYDFHAFRQAGEQLAQWHLNYESVEPYPLEWVTDETAGRNFKVEKMYLRGETLSPDENKAYDSLQYNDYLTLRGFPPEAFDYRLGSRSALEWIVDRYRVTKDARTGIVNDPNLFSDDPRYIIDLIGKVTRVSVETVNIINQLPALFEINKEV